MQKQIAIKKQRQKTNNRARLVLGITGSFGSGKTTVASLFHKGRSASLIDADKIASQYIKPGSPAYKKIIRFFGTRLLKADKEINRSLLAGIVFNDLKLLSRLNKIVHPYVIKEIKEKIGTLKAELVILDAPLLIEAGLKDLVDKLVVVTITRNAQIKRLKAKTHFTLKQILARIRSQAPLRTKARLADFIIDNSSTLEHTIKQVEAIRRLLWKK